MANPLLSAAMIVRDEASNLPACLESIRDVVDEMVIVDTGSSDETVSIARSFGARVHVHPWHGDFAHARNAGLELSNGTWILYIDADERLRPIEREVVRSILEEATDKAALRLRLVPFVGATPFWEFRLWRSDPRIRFAGMMHEKVTPAIRRVAVADRLTIGDSELCLDHVGYQGDQTAKHERNLPLLRAQLAAEPESAHDWTHLARVLEGLGRPAESEAALDRAVQIAREPRVSVDVAAYIELIHRHRNRGDNVTEMLDDALARYPDNVGLAGHKAEIEMDAGRYDEALRWLERFDADPEMPIEDTIAYPAELFGPWVTEARALCYFNLGNYREAAAAYRQAEEFDPHAQPLRLKRILSEHRAGLQPEDAVAAEPAYASQGALWAGRELLRGLTIDVGGVAVGLSATDAVRAAAIRSVLGRMTPSQHEPDVSMAFGSHMQPLPERGPDETQGDLQLWHDEAALTIACGTTVSARVESSHGEVGGYTTHLGLAFHHVAPFMLSSLLAPHGRFLLHAGAIQIAGQAVLVLGGSGVGKSTLILGALQNGWNVLSDDLVMIRSGSGGPVVSGIPQGLVVPTEVITGGAPARPRSTDHRGRQQLPFEAWDRGWHPIRGIVIVAHGNAEHTEIEPVDTSWLLGVLTYSMLCRQPIRVREYTRHAISLCRLPACRLLHSQAPENRAQSAIETMATHLRWT
jgi:glycosyltransferase involved in cell wall biosynthesis